IEGLGKRGPAMSLRKSPTLTPALLASNRRNAQKSTVPRTARGKAWSRLNRLRGGGCSKEYSNFWEAVLGAPPGRVEETVGALLASKQVIHPLIMRAAETSIEILG